MMSFFRISALAAGSPDRLGKKSTAQEVLETLRRTNRLAPCVPASADGDDGDGTRRGVAVITGANSGIGAASVETLARAGMRVVLCARDADAAAAVVAHLPAQCRPRCRVQALDLSDLGSVRAAAEEIGAALGDGERIDVLLNNAGVMATPERRATEQGFELQFGVNHVGHHMLTRLLLGKMSDEGRIVTVASTAHNRGEVDFSDLNFQGGARKYTPWGAYGQSKLANILFAKGLSDRLEGEGSRIKSVSLHPGVIITNLWRHTPKWTRPIVNLLFADKTVEQGAATNVYCALVEAAAFEGGEYCTDCGVAEPNASGQDADRVLRTQLWTATERLIKEAGYTLPESLLEK